MLPKIILKIGRPVLFMKPFKPAPVFTYQTRITGEGEVLAVLDAYSCLYGKAERSLFAAMQKPGIDLNELKRTFLARFKMTSRQFNAMRVGLQGKIDSIKSRRPELIPQLQTKIKAAEKVVAKLGLYSHKAEKLHHKKRRLESLKDRLSNMQDDEAAGIVRLCFGSRKLFNAQFNLEANGYDNHGEWLKDWQAIRNAQFFVLGSRDETAGNQSCQASINEDNSLTLRLRLPNGLVGPGQEKHLTLDGVRFAYGHGAIVNAIQSSHKIQTTNKAGKPVAKRTGTSVSYRFLKDAKGWRVFVSCQSPEVPRVTSRLAGAIGIDINSDHMAVCETDRFGNLIACRRIDLNLTGKTTQQANALIEAATGEATQWARSCGKPAIIERLDFSKKKAELVAGNTKHARMLSSFAYGKIISSLKSSCFRAGVGVIEVNPAYTSVIGAVNFAQQKGISTHMGAALAVARRGLGLSEKVSVPEGVCPSRSGGHVAFCLPARNRQKHVWSQWAKIRIALRAALAAHHRSGACFQAPAPLPPAIQALGASRSLTAQFRQANRQQHRLAGVMDGVSR